MAMVQVKVAIKSNIDFFVKKGKNRLAKTAQAAKLVNLSCNECLFVLVYEELNHFFDTT